MKPPIAKRNTRIFTIMQFFQALIFVIPIWIVYQQQFLSPTQITFLVGWGYLVQLLLELPTGAFADLVGKRISLLVSAGLTALSFALIPLAQDFGGFMILETLAGLGTAFFSGSQEALLYDSLKQDGKEAEFRQELAKNGFWFQIGLMIATASGGFIYGLGHYLPYFASAAAAVGGGILAYWLIEPKIDTEKFSVASYWRQIVIGVKETTKTRETKLVSTYYIVVGSITWLCQTVFNSYLLIDLGFGDQARGIIGALIRLINISIIVKVIKNEKIFTHKVAFWFFPLLMTISMLPGYWLEGAWGIPTVAGVMMASTARWIVLAKYTNEAYESKYRATAISALSMAIGLIFFVGSSGAGFVIEYFGSSKALFTIFGVTTLLIVVPLANKIVRLPRYAK